MWSLRKPTDGELAEFLKHQAQASFTYGEVGLTASEERWPCGFDHDRNRILLGKGADIFERARHALSDWRHFPSAWTMIFPADAPIAPGNTIAVLIRALGVWWWNSARIVYTIDETGLTPRFGFAYGTLPAHAERGEEQFLVEMDARAKRLVLHPIVLAPSAVGRSAGVSSCPTLATSICSRFVCGNRRHSIHRIIHSGIAPQSGTAIPLYQLP